MKHGSLFSGIGGFDLAAEWMKWENVFHCEWNPFGQRVLKHYWPNAESFDDITKTDFRKYHGAIDIISGGFPCQPYSAAGKRLGKEDERHLWPEMLRAIREIAPRYVVGENVRGLTNWNGGLVFDEVCTDLENLGYQVAPFLIPACAVNAPHRRERIWFVAYCENYRSSQTKTTDRRQECHPNNGHDIRSTPYKNGNERPATDTDSFRQHECKCEYEELASEGGQYAQRDIGANDERGDDSNSDSSSSQRGNSQATQEREEQSGRAEPFSEHTSWEVFPTQSPICGGDDGLPTKLDGITFPKWRKESIKAYGNAVVPQVVYQIFKAIESYENL